MEEQAKIAAENFVAKLSDIASVYAEALEAGTDEATIFGQCRDEFMRLMGVGKIQAANLARIVLHLAATKMTGTISPYTQDDMGVIISKAFSA